MDSKPSVSYEDFAKLDLKIGKILEAEAVPESVKLLRLIVDDGERRQIVAGIKKSYAPEDIVGKQILFIANLEPKKLAGLESFGMVLVAHNTDEYILVMPEKEVPNGSSVA